VPLIAPPPPTPHAADAPCPSCGEAFRGRFCPRCGERRLGRDRYSLRQFAAEAVEAVANLDGRLLRTVRTLFLRPGLLSAEYFAGRRTPYLRPLQLFLISNVFFFLAQGMTRSRVLDTPLEVHVHSSMHQRLAHRWVYGAAHVPDEPDTPALERFRARFDMAVESQSRTLVIVMVPMMALVLTALFLLRRRYFVEHVVFATHFYSFLLVGSPVALAVLIQVLRGARRLGADVAWFGEGALSLAMTLIWGIYLALAARRFYGLGRLGAIWRGAVLAFGTMLVLFAYRFVLFFTAYYAASRA
jgi:hypothetical protein